MTIKLYLGRKTPSGIVTDAKLSGFLTQVVTPIFSGFTVTNTLGYWEGVSEPSFVLEFCALEDNPLIHHISADCRWIGLQYCLRFEQKAYLLSICDSKNELRFTERGKDADAND